MAPSVALLMALTTLSSLTAGGASATRARLVVDAPARCLTRDDLVRRVKARTPRVDFTDDAMIIAAVAVTAYSPEAQVVQLDLMRPGQQLRPRILKTHTCAKTADAVALILAITLDPTSQISSPQSGPEKSAASAEPPAPAPAATPGTHVTVAAPPSDAGPAATRTTASSRGPRTPLAANRPVTAVKPAAPEAPPILSTAPAPAIAATAGTAPETRKAVLELSLSATADTMSGVAPQLLPGFSLVTMLETARDGAWAPALAVGWTHLWRTGMAGAAATASFTLDAGTVDACPLRWRWSKLSLRPCASFLLGRLATRGSGTADDRGAARPFSTAGVSVQARFGGTVQLTARLGLGVALVRDSYAFGDQVFYRAGFFTPTAALGAGFRWP